MNESSVLAVWTQEQTYDRIVKLIENAKTKVLDTFDNEKIAEAISVYAANYLVWRVAEVIANILKDEERVIKFLDMRNESNLAYLDDVLSGWRKGHSAHNP